MSLVQGFPSLQSLLEQHSLQPSGQQWGVEPPHVSLHVPQAQLFVQVLVPGHVVPDGVHGWVSPVKHWLEALSTQVPQAPQVQPEPHVRLCVPQLPLPQSWVLVSPCQHWLVPLSVQVPQSLQLQSSPQVRVCVPQLPSPQSRNSPEPGSVQSQAVFSHAPHVQELPQSWPPVHEATSVQSLDAPMTHSKASSIRPLQSLSTASQSSVALVIVHSQPFPSLPSAFP